ncbi:hypothetical protein JK231_10940 [Pantoea sp. JGM49]|uniref:hypothetical protein n=1 Tax=Pantoea sp. JGM49 TaxID=2799791 RepID=UPI001BA81C76|nr:hypothetical protein [Pantoea sp. JGM49]MBS0881116.1 hypothetical protein [Pantoea sp. JGM49]
MVVYQVSVMAHGPVRIRKVQDGDGDVVFLFGDKGVVVFEQIARYGVRYITDNPDLIHMLDFTHGKALKETLPNTHPGVHAVVFGD